MQKIHGEIQQLGGDVLVVTFATVPQLAEFVAAFPLPFPVVADVDRRLYQAFELGSTSPRGLMRLRVMWHYLKLMLRGWIPGRPAENADIWQLGGDFILDREGRVRYAHPSADPSDRPSNDVLLSEMRKAAESIG